MNDDPTQLEHRVSFAKAALLDSGRDDLAAQIWSYEECLAYGTTAITWRMGDSIIGEDRVLMWRAAALASLSTGFDARSLPCENCLRSGKPSWGCADQVTRSEFVARTKMCDG